MRINQAKAETVVFTGANTEYSFLDLSNSEGFCAQVALTLASYGNANFNNAATAVAATLVVQTDLTLTAATAGHDGNSITLAIVAGGTAGAEEVTVVGNAISVSADVTPVTGSTITQVRTAINAKTEAAALVTASGTSATVIAALPATPLAGGYNISLNLTDNTVTFPVDPGWATGTKAALTAASGSLATGLSATDYWMIKVSTGVYKFATSMANAHAGTAVNITAAATGIGLLTAAASAGSIYIGYSNSLSRTNPVALTSEITSGASGYNGVMYGRYAIVYGTITSGTVSVAINMAAKGVPNE